METLALLRRIVAQWARWSAILMLAMPLILAACGNDAGESGVKVIITPAPPTPTSVPRNPGAPTLAPVTPVAFPPNAPTITNAVGSQLMVGVKARVKDSADGLILRDTPSTKGKIVESLPAGAALSVLSDPQDAEGRTWVKVSHGNNQGYVAAEFVERTQ